MAPPTSMTIYRRARVYRPGTIDQHDVCQPAIQKTRSRKVHEKSFRIPQSQDPKQHTNASH